MKRKTNRNVIAPDQTVKGVRQYLEEIGFSHCGYINKNQVMTRFIAETQGFCNSLYLVIIGYKLRIYRGLKTGGKISASGLYECSIYNIREAISLLAEQGFMNC